MTIKSEIGKMYCSFPCTSGEWKEISATINMPHVSESEMIESSTIGNSFSINLDCDIKYENGLNAEDFWLILCGICAIEQVTCNNWRKMHHMPLKRRRKKA